MNRYKGTLILTLISALAGWSLGNDSLALFGWGIVIFLPAVVYYVAKNEGLIFSVLGSLTGTLVASLFAGTDNGISVLEMIVPGLILFFIFKRKWKEEYILFSTTLYFYLISIIEDFYFGPPKDLTNFQTVLQFRWGLYFFTSSLFSLIVISSIVILGKEEFDFKKVRFGTLPIAAFIGGGVLTLIKWIPELQVIGANTILTACGFFLLQGFGVTVTLFENKNPFIRFGAIFLAILFPLLAIVTITLSGLFDFWFDFRKLQGGKK